MKTETRIFGTIEIEDEKVITMEKGMIGFPELQHFAIIFNEEKKPEERTISWLQSLDDGDVAFPVMEPSFVKPDYAPAVNEELLAPLGELTVENTYILVTVTVPHDIEKITCNLHAPIIINTGTNKAAQIIVDNDDYPIRFPFYEVLKARKDGDK